MKKKRKLADADKNKAAVDKINAADNDFPTETTQRLVINSMIKKFLLKSLSELKLHRKAKDLG